MRSFIHYAPKSILLPAIAAAFVLLLFCAASAKACDAPVFSAPVGCAQQQAYSAPVFAAPAPVYQAPVIVQQQVPVYQQAVVPQAAVVYQAPVQRQVIVQRQVAYAPVLAAPVVRAPRVGVIGRLRAGRAVSRTVVRQRGVVAAAAIY